MIGNLLKAKKDKEHDEKINNALYTVYSEKLEEVYQVQDEVNTIFKKLQENESAKPKRETMKFYKQQYEVLMELMVAQSAFITTQEDALNLLHDFFVKKGVLK